jgi:ubiquinone/menaquinone biosynthesis C-methylase UbiE
MKNQLVPTNKLEQSYFFAFEDIRFYDFTIDLVNPYYQIMHNMCVDLVMNKFKMQPITILDIGAGTGAESLRILKNNPNAKIVALDISSQMRKKFMAKAAKHLEKKCLKENIHYEVGDFLELSHKELLALNDNKKFDLIITAYTIHHFVVGEKKIIYEKIYDLLIDNGVFINIDLFNYADEEMSTEAHKFEIDWINQKFEYPELTSPEAGKISLTKRRKLKEKWTQHYENDNILDAYELQRGYLIDKGISSVEMPFRFYQNGLLWAKK